MGGWCVLGPRRLRAASCAACEGAFVARLLRAPRGSGECCATPRAGTFKLTLTFTEDYPNKAPTVRFESKMFHPNSACAAPLPSLAFFDRVARDARPCAQSMPTAASASTSCKTTGAPSTTCRRCSPPSSHCSVTPTQTRQPTPRRRACTPSAGACAAASRPRTVADFAPAADGSTTSVCRRARLFGALLPAAAADALSHRRRLWSSLGRCHDHLPGREGPLYPRRFC